MEKDRSLEHYAFRIILVVTAAICGSIAVVKGGFLLWFLAAGMLGMGMMRQDIDVAWEWWSYVCVAVYFLATSVQTLVSGLGDGLKPEAMPYLVMVGTLAALLAVLISGRVRRVWGFCRPK